MFSKLNTFIYALVFLSEIVAVNRSTLVIICTTGFIVKQVRKLPKSVMLLAHRSFIAPRCLIRD